MADVRLEVVAHLAARREPMPRKRKAKAGEPVVLRGAVQPQRVVSGAPVVADAIVSFEDDEVNSSFREVIRGCQTCLARTDDDCFVPLCAGRVHRGYLRGDPASFTNAAGSSK